MTTNNSTTTPVAYRIQQLGPPRDVDGGVLRTRGGTQRNERVVGFDSLVSHHPGDNRAVRMENGISIDGKPGRTHGYVGGILEEIEVPRRDLRGQFQDFGLAPGQVLLKKDFILSDPALDAMTRAGRSVDVPAPVAGIVGARRDGQGLVDIIDPLSGDVLARIRHMRAIEVHVGDTVQYGQTIGMQSNVGTEPIHVHREMDTRYYLQFRNYVDDLASGRLPMDARHREGIVPRPVAHDGSFRLGEADARIGDLQRVMTVEGYRSAGGAPLDQDGVYRPRMQGALLDFQRDHGLPQSGDIDAATLRFAPPPPRREVDRHDHAGAHGFPPREAAPPTAPGHPDHPDHRPLPAEPEPPRNGRPASAVLFEDPLLRSFAAALESGDRDVVSRACDDLARSPRMQAFLAQGREALQAFEAQQAEAPARDAEVAALARG